MLNCNSNQWDLSQGEEKKNPQLWDTDRLSWPDKINLQTMEELAQSILELFVIVTENLMKAGNVTEDSKSASWHLHSRLYYNNLISPVMR